MRNLDLHGLRVRVDDRLHGAPSEALLGSFPNAEGSRPVSLHVRLRPSPGRRSLPPDGSPSFFHGAVRAVARRGALVLGDGASVLTVSADGSSIEGDVHADSLADPHAFAHATLLLALVLALRHHGLFHLHAAGLVTPGGTPLLVAGDAGAGKSTAALAFAAAGFAYLGDDAVLLQRSGAEVRLLAIPRAFHVGAATAESHPALAHAVGGAYGATGKRFLDPALAFPDAARIEAGPPELILIPSIGPGDASVTVPVPASEALGALLEASALVAVDGAARPAEHLAALGVVASGARAWRVRLGRDVLDDPAGWARRIAAGCGR